MATTPKREQMPNVTHLPRRFEILEAVQLPAPKTLVTAVAAATVRAPAPLPQGPAAATRPAAAAADVAHVLCSA